MAVIPYSVPCTLTFTTARGHIVQGAKQYTGAVGIAREQPVEVVVLTDGTILGAEHDRILWGAVHGDGTLLFSSLDAGLDEGAALARVRTDGQPLPSSELDAAALRGRWVGAYSGFGNGDMTHGHCPIDVSDSNGQLLCGSGMYKRGDGDWSVAQPHRGVPGGAGELTLSTPTGYLIGHMSDDDTMELSCLQVGMDNAAVSMRLHLHVVALLGTPMSESEAPDIDLLGLWSGPGWAHQQGNVVGGIKERAITSRETSAFGGTRRWHNGDGQWLPTEALYVVALANGLIAMNEEAAIMSCSAG